MDNAKIEMLSRYLDGDLDPDDERVFSGQLESDPDLRSRLEQLQTLRSSLSSLAGSEQVPGALDSLVEPLRRGRPEALAGRPWVRWLATAAVAVVGLTIIFEVNLSGPRRPPSDSSRTGVRQPPALPSERFSLAPLPESSVPPEEQLLGVSERLLASPVPEVEVDEPPALHVLGPLEVPPTNDPGARRVSEEKSRPAVTAKAGIGVAAVATPSQPEVESGLREKSLADSSQTAPLEERAEASDRARPSTANQLWDGEGSMGRAQLFIFTAGETTWQEFEPAARCNPGRYPVRIRITGGVVREVWSVAGATPDSRSQHTCASELVRGLAVAEVADGDYSAQVVIVPRGARAE